MSNNLIGQPRESWGSRFGVILAVMGSAVGLGNFLRFPGQAAMNGGGAFMIPYMVAFLLLGLPIAWAEWAMGRYGGTKGYNSPPGIFRAVLGRNSAGAYIGVLAVVMPVLIYMYYVLVEGWCLAYAVRYLFGEMSPEAITSGAVGNVAATGKEGMSAATDAYNSFFGTISGAGKDGSAMSFFGEEGTKGLLNSAYFFMLICFVLNFYLIYRGLTKGIEWFCRWAMPALVICSLIVLVRVLTLGTPNPELPDQNILSGLGTMWNPTQADKSFTDSLLNANTWLAAAGQIFFSLSVGFGLIITYASYTKKDDDIALSSLTAAAGNGFCEVIFGGLMIIPAAFIFLGPIDPGTLNSSFTIGFKVLPNVFYHMPAGEFFGFLFFFLLFLAAVTSSLSMLQPAIALLEEGLGLKRRVSVLFLGMITLMGSSFVAYFSKDLAALDTVDFWMGQLCIFILATLQVFVFSWIWGIKRGMKELRNGAEIKIPSLLGFVLKFITPTYLLIVFGVWLYQNLISVTDPSESRILLLFQKENMVPRMAVFGIFGIMAFFTLIVFHSIKRWEKQEELLAESGEQLVENEEVI